MMSGRPNSPLTLAKPALPAAIICKMTVQPAVPTSNLSFFSKLGRKRRLSPVYSITTHKLKLRERLVDSDSELVRRVKGGDLNAFSALCRRYEKAALALALRCTNDIQWAEDVVQESLLLAYRRIDSLNEFSKFGAWLTTIVRRQAVDAVRSKKVAVGSLPADGGFELHTVPHSEAWVEHEALLTLIDRLSENDQLLIGLRYFDQHPVSMIAAMTNQPVGTVTKQLSRAVDRLRTWWNKEN